MKEETTNTRARKPEDDPLGECFILKEIQELVYINKNGRKLFVTYINENVRRASDSKHNRVSG